MLFLSGTVVIENINNISEKVLEFDIYLLNTNKKTEELKYSLGQYFLDFNSKIANGGNLIYTIVNSDLPESMRPRNASVSGNQLRLICNSINPDKANLPLISSKDKGKYCEYFKTDPKTSTNKYLIKMEIYTNENGNVIFSKEIKLKVN